MGCRKVPLPISAVPAVEINLTSVPSLNGRFWFRLPLFGGISHRFVITAGSTKRSDFETDGEAVAASATRR
jgi:hypothetical protein